MFRRPLLASRRLLRAEAVVRLGMLLLLVTLLLSSLPSPSPSRAVSGLGQPTTSLLGDRRALDRLLVFSRTTGFRHDAIPDAIAALGSLGALHGFAVDATEDPAVFEDGQLAAYRAVVFLLTTGDVLDAQQQAAFERYIRAGNGYVGIHSASDTEYDWPWYGGLVGAYFSSHPAIQTASIHLEETTHPSTIGLPPTWVRSDEWYNFRANPRGNVSVLARLDETSYTGGTMGQDHPIAWYHLYDGGRAWYTAGGHTRESYAEPLFLQHLLGGLQYAAGLVSALAGGGAEAPEPASAPAGALVLFDGTDTASWQTRKGAPIGWPIVDGALEVCPGCGDVRTVRTFQDFRLHLEFRLPTSPDDASEQDRGNSGVYLQGRYELQVLDSFGRDLSGADDGGAIYGLKDADRNASRPGETWQSYDVTFRAARWAGGTRTEPARLTVHWNGVLVHDNLPLPAPTPGGSAESPEPGPILLQDHGQPVRYRNIWIEPLS